MHVNRGFLVNERSARHIGIQRGSVGSFDPCVPDRVSTRAITDQERSEARITGTADRSFILGSWQIEQIEQAARAANPEPVKAGKVKAPRKARASKVKPVEPTATDKRRERMSLDDYYREQRACGGRS